MKKILHIVHNSICVLIASIAIIASVSTVNAALVRTPSNISANDIARLRAQLLSTDTGATLEPVKKWVNGVRVTGCFDSPSAFILIEDDLGRREWASYDTKSCDSEYVTSISGMRRGLSPVNPAFSAGTGMNFDAGAQVRVADYPLIYNNATYKDVVTLFTGSGMIACGSVNNQPCISVGSFTSAQRDAFTYNTGATIIRNTTIGALQYYDGSSWLTLAVSTGSFINASQVAAGKVEIASFDEVRSLTQTGATSALVVLTPMHLIKNGTGSVSAGRIPITNAKGVLSFSLGGTGIRSIQTGALLVGQSGSAITGIVGTTSNQVPVWDGTRWAAGTPTIDVNILTGSIANSNTLTNPQSVVRFTQTGALSSAHLNVKGNMFEVFAAGDSGWGAGAMTVTLFVGDTNVGNCAFTPTATGQAWSVIFRGTTRTAGASGVMQVNSLGSMGSGTNQKACAAGTTTSSYDFTSNKVVNIGISFSASNGTNAATMQQLQVESRAP